MADFLSNLLLRNGIPSAVETSAAILQPRLPSLFENSHDADQFSSLQFDSLESDISPRSRGASTAAASAPVSPASRLTIMEEPGEPQPAIIPAVRGESSTLRQKILVSPPQEKRRPNDPKPKMSEAQPPTETVQTAQPRPTPDVSRRIAPPPTKGKSTGDAKSTESEDRPFVANEDTQATQVDLTPFSPQRIKMRPLRLEEAGSSLQMEADTQLKAGEHSIERPAGRHLESFSIRAAGNPAIVMQPAPISVRAEVKHQAEQSRDQEAQRVVEIHIGRIEVRAALPNPSPKRSTNAAPVMSLDEYLRRRREGDR